MSSQVGGSELLDHLISYFSETPELPGWRSHSKAAPPGRTEHLSGGEAGRSARRAGVLICLSPSEKDNQYGFFLMRRTSRHGDQHSGQISLPGGSWEPQDQNLWSTALREYSEEMGVGTEDIRRIGALSPLYIPPSDFLVFPYLAWTNEVIKPKPQITEVAEVFRISIRDFLSMEVLLANSNESSNTSQNFPSFQHLGHIIWGATAMILQEFQDILLDQRG